MLFIVLIGFLGHFQLKMKHYYSKLTFINNQQCKTCRFLYYLCKNMFNATIFQSTIFSVNINSKEIYEKTILIFCMLNRGFMC